MPVRPAKKPAPRKQVAHAASKGWYRDRRNRWHQLRKADGWTWDKKRKRMRNAHPERWYRDRDGIWRKRTSATTKTAPAAVAGAPAATAPTPTGLAADGGEDRVALRWNAPPSPASQVEVLRSTNAETGFDVVVKLGAKTTTWTDTKVVLDGAYFYAIRSVAADGTVSPASAPVDAEVRDRTDPPAPGAMAGTGADKAVVLHWAKSADRWLAGYDIYRALDRVGPFVKVGTASAGSLGWTDRSLTNGVTYFHYVVARDSSGHTSAPSEIIATVAADSTLPATPAAVTLTPGEALVLASWPAVADKDLKGYELLRSTSASGGFTTIADLPAGTTAYEDLDVTGTQTYFYAVRARDTSGNASVPSPTAFAAPATNLTPSAPRSVVTIAGDAHVTVAWPAGQEGDLASYEVFHSASASGPWTSAGTVPATSTGLTLTGLANGAQRFVCVATIDKGGLRSPRSAPVGVTPVAAGPVPVHSGAFTAAHAERLAWRAGFGPKPGQVDALVAAGRDAAVKSFTQPSATSLVGPAPTTTLDPRNAYGHDHAAWVDRMARSTNQLQERMALVFHDWFATSTNGVDTAALMDDQLALLRKHALGNFHTLTREITADPAMLIWLSGFENRKGAPNENYARELMELFTLGADRGAYSERDVRELARALTGWSRKYAADGSWSAFFDPNRFDSGTKTVFGQTGNFDWQDAVRLCIEHPGHASYFVERLWGAFVPGTPSDATRIALERIYVDSGHEVLPVLEAIFRTPDFLAGPERVADPVTVTAAMLRATGQPLRGTGWYSWSSEAGQRLLYPPDVSGWHEDRWLGTSTVHGRWLLAQNFLDPIKLTGSTYSPTETPQQALDAALAFWGGPSLTQGTRDELLAYAQRAIPASAETTDANRRAFRMSRQNGLRLLIAMSPDFHIT